MKIIFVLQKSMSSSKSGRTFVRFDYGKTTVTHISRYKIRIYKKTVSRSGMSYVIKLELR